MSARREELLDLAESIIEEDGLEAFSLGSLARAAGIRTPSLYKHFASLTDLEHGLISRGFTRLASSLDKAGEAASSRSGENSLVQFARAYRAYALTHPQLYRLVTERPLDRTRLTPGVEAAAMRALLQYFDETVENHDRARAVWAAAHGLVSLELSGRFPPRSNLDGAWAAFTHAFTV